MSMMGRKRMEREVRYVEEWETPAYRRYTEALLRRYFRMSMSLGSLPSALDHPSHEPPKAFHKISSFEEAVNFVMDVELALGNLRERQLELLAAALMLDCTQMETGRMVGISERHVSRLYPKALDLATRALLRRGLMKPLDRICEEELPPRRPMASAGVLMMETTQAQALWM